MSIIPSLLARQHSSNSRRRQRLVFLVSQLRRIPVMAYRATLQKKKIPGGRPPATRVVHDRPVSAASRSSEVESTGTTATASRGLPIHFLPRLPPYPCVVSTCGLLTRVMGRRGSSSGLPQLVSPSSGRECWAKAKVNEKKIEKKKSGCGDSMKLFPAGESSQRSCFVRTHRARLSLGRHPRPSWVF